VTENKAEIENTETIAADESLTADQLDTIAGGNNWRPPNPDLFTRRVEDAGQQPMRPRTR
jgi:hypothetical protein